MSSILVVNPPVSFDGTLFNEPPFSNIGMYYSLAHLKGNFDVDVIDSFLHSPIHTEGDRTMMGGEVTELLSHIEDLNKIYDYVLVNFSWFMRKDMDDGDVSKYKILVNRLKTITEATIILCDFHTGHMFFEKYDPAYYLSELNEVDAIFTGIAEHHLIDILISHDFSPVEGVAYRYGGKIHFTGFNLDYVDMLSDDSPPPAYDFIDMDAYRNFIQDAIRHNLIQEQDTDSFFLPLMLSRGCAFNCNFCGLGEGKSNWQGHSSEYIESLFLDMYEKFDVDKFLFLDPSMNSNPSWFKSVLKILKKNSMRCFVPNGLRGDMIDDETVILLKEVTDCVLVSLETQNTKIVNDTCGKKFNISRFHDFIKKAYDVGLPVKAHYIIGFPEETIEDMCGTLRHAIDLYDEYNLFPLLEIATPLPDTSFYESCRKNSNLSVDDEVLKRKYHKSIESESLINGMSFSAQDVTELYGLFKKYVCNGRMREFILSPTFSCNDNCIHCMFKGLKLRDKSYEECKKIIDDSAEKGYEVVCFEGGEPTIFPGIIELVRYSSEKGFSDLFMESNGRMFANKRFAQKMMQAGVNPLHIALHSWRPEIHDYIVQSPGSHNQVIKGLSNIRSLGYLSRVKINIPFNKNNINDVEKTVTFCYNLGIRKIFLQYLTHKRGLKRDEELPKYEDASAVMRSAIDRFGSSMEIMTQNMPLCEMKGYESYVLPDIGNTGYFDELGERRAIVDELAYGKVKDERCENCIYGFLCTGYLPSRS